MTAASILCFTALFRDGADPQKRTIGNNWHQFFTRQTLLLVLKQRRQLKAFTPTRENHPLDFMSFLSRICKETDASLIILGTKLKRCRRCGLILQMSHIALSVSVSVCVPMMGDGSGINWTSNGISLQTDNPTSTSSLNFYKPDALPDTQQTVSKHLKVLSH